MGAQEPRGREGPACAQPCRDAAHTPRGVHGQRPGISVTDTAPPPPPRTPRPRRPHAPVSRAWPGVWLRPRSGANGPSLPPWPGLVPRRPCRCLSARWLLAAPTPGVCGAAAPSLAHAPHGTTGPRVHLWGPVWPSPMGTPSTSRPRARRRPRLSETAAGPRRSRECRLGTALCRAAVGGGLRATSGRSPATQQGTRDTSPPLGPRGALASGCRCGDLVQRSPRHSSVTRDRARPSGPAPAQEGACLGAQV